MALPKKIGKAFGVALVGMLLLFLLAFFVSMFLVSRGSSSVVGGFGRGMMRTGTSSAWAVPNIMNSLGGDTVGISGTPGRMMGQAAVGGMMENVATPMMGFAKKVIKNGDLNLLVTDADQALTQISQIAEELGGDVVDSRFSEIIARRKTGTVTVKVPIDKFNEAFTRLKGVAAVVVSESTSGTDVTEQYIDLQARINNQKAAEVTLQTLFEKAVKISDVIEIADRLAIVRGQIESLEGQLRYLNSQTDRASITVSLTEDVTVTTDQGFRPLQTLKESLATLIHMLGNLTAGSIRFLIVVFPMLLAYGILFWFIYRFVRRAVMKVWYGSDKRRMLRKK